MTMILIFTKPASLKSNVINTKHLHLIFLLSQTQWASYLNSLEESNLGRGLRQSVGLQICL